MQDLAGCRLASETAARVRWFPARLPSHGDLSTDAALLVGRADGGFAARLAERLAGLPAVREVQVAGPGFINLTYTDAALDGVLPALLDGLVCDRLPADAGPWPLASMRRSDPDFMVQHAHARCRSVLRAAAGIPGLGWDDPALLAAEARGWFVSGPPRALLCRLDHWMRIDQAPGPLDGDRGIPLFLRDLSLWFDRMWKLSHDDATLRLLHPGQPSRSLAVLALVLATADVIRSGLGMQGLEAAEEIR